MFVCVCVCVLSATKLYIATNNTCTDASTNSGEGRHGPDKKRQIRDRQETDKRQARGRQEVDKRQIRGRQTRGRRDRPEANKRQTRDT
jgi:hypothetical protein